MSLVLRFFHIAWLITVGFFGYLGARLRAPRMSRRERSRLRGRHLASLLDRLGATFVKFGQILSTRPDVLPAGIIEGLSKLQDRVRPFPFSEAERVLVEELGEGGRARIAHLEEEPVAAASVAQVHRGELDDGRKVAVKIQRPAARSQVERDLFLMGLFARMLDRIPQVRLLSLPGSVERFADAMRKQVDFRIEAENNRRFAENFADAEGIDVPELIDDLCTARVLTMEFVDGVKATEPEKVGGDRKLLARRGLEAMLRMVFRDGFVHADLHPGNILLTSDDRVVLIDLGLVAEIPPAMMRPWIETFVALSNRDGSAAARLFYGYAPSVATRSYPDFEADVLSYFETFWGKPLSELEAGAIVAGMMNVLRKHRVQIDPVFTVVNLAMLVAEGLGKQLDPDIDLVALATPHLAEAMMHAPEGKEPLREPPEEKRAA